MAIISKVILMVLQHEGGGAVVRDLGHACCLRAAEKARRAARPVETYGCRAELWEGQSYR